MPQGLLMSLATKLIAAIVVLLVLAVGAAGFYSYNAISTMGAEEAERARQQGEAAMKAQAQLVAQNLAQAAAPALADYNPGFLTSLVENAVKNDARLEWVVVADEQAEGKIAVRAGKSAPTGESLTDEMAAELRKDRTAKVLERVDPDVATRLVFGANVRFGERTVGQIRLAVSTEELQAALEKSIAAARERATRSARQLALVAGLVVIVGILIGMQQSLRIVRPLRALTRQATRIAGGDFAERVTVGSRDEVGQLASAFNSMANGLGVLLKEMAGKASMERELQLARSVQELMSPPPAPIHLGPFTLAGHCETATQCGGDWWTYRRLDDDHILVVIGDVTGHGMPAAMIAATARGAVEGLAMVEPARITPRLVLDAIDGAIRDVGNSALLMTCFAMVLDAKQGVVQFANAGHMFPYVARSEGDGALQDLHALAVSGNPLGTTNKCVTEARAELVPGQVIVLSTDGLIDRLSPSGERWGDKRFRKVLQRTPRGSDPAHLRDKVVEEVHKFGANCPADDDITLVVLSYSGAGSARGSATRAAAAGR